VGARDLLLVTCGDSRLDNRKVKAALGGKARMLPPDEAAAITGHPVGGVCPFGLASPLPIYCDVQLRRYDVVVTGGGSTHSAVRINPLRMAELAGAEWVDVCEDQL
jgi:prolyl-tRNA editing enzyme YbaK/EbsC (Cys-tRNA(Pro) deacylase)